VRVGALTWFVTDSLASLAAGAAPNLVLNAALLALTWWATFQPRDAMVEIRELAPD